MLPLSLHTNFEQNILFEEKNTFCLNAGNALNEVIINNSRKQWCLPLSRSGQEECAEFCQFILNDFISSAKEEENISIFQKVYLNNLKLKSNVLNAIQLVKFLLRVLFYQYHQMNIHLKKKKKIRFILYGKIIRYCDIYQHDKECSFKKTMIKTPDFLIIQILHYKFHSNLQITEKDFNFIELPESLSIPN